MTELDAKATDVFAGRVVRKDLARKIKIGANVPVFVLEYLLGKYCATDDPYAIEAGLRVVQNTLADNLVRADEANKAQSKVKEKGRHTFIDKVRVRYLADDDKYWAELSNFGHKFVHIPERYIRDYDRLLTGGIWAEMEMNHLYDEEVKGKRSPFWIENLKPIQIATFNLDEYREGRQVFTNDEWLDLMIRSIGMEPHHFDRRQKILFLVRLIPLCERNYNLVELGPRGTGKSYGVQEVSPYSILLTGPTTVANLFYNMATGKVGLVGMWDAVAFDEVADLQKMPKEVVTTLKTYCESGTFARGKDSFSGNASIALFGNTNQPIDVMVRSSHLFAPMPDVIRDDMAFLDRLHFYIPGWELPKMRVEYFTEHYGFIVDYLAEALHDMRRFSFTETLDQYFSMGAHLNARDVKAVRKTVSGLMKLLYPHGEVTREEMAELVETALEGRRRVKEQLKKLGSFEYHQTSFSYFDRESLTEQYVGVREEGGRDLIAHDPLAPGSVYAASVDNHAKIGLYRLEVGLAAGTGKLRLTGGVTGAMQEAIRRAFGYLQGNKGLFGIGAAFDSNDFHVEAIDLLANRTECEAGVAFVIAMVSALRRHPITAGTIILGDLSIQGNIKAVQSLTEPLQIAMENGARRALVPLANKRNLMDLDEAILERVDLVFYSDMFQGTQKALALT